MKNTANQRLAIPYIMWIVFFVLAPFALLIYQSLFDIHGQLTLSNYFNFLTSKNYLLMTISSFILATIITILTLLLAYPTAYLLAQTKYKLLWSMFIILPTWINLLLKVYAFIGILSQRGPIVSWLNELGFQEPQLLFTNLSFVLVAVYVELPFMIQPIFNSIDEIPQNLIEASTDLGATSLQTIRQIIFPLSLPGVRSGIQTVFIPSLSLFMIARLIGGNRVITLGTAVEQHFLVTQNWGMGATIGVILMISMMLVMYVTRERRGNSHE